MGVQGLVGKLWSISPIRRIPAQVRPKMAASVSHPQSKAVDMIASKTEAGAAGL